MSNSQKYVGKNLWVFYIMIFAFFWLVIGELITLHQKAIYGFDPFSQHIPFAKPNSSGNNAHFNKVVKFDKYKDQFHFDTLVQDEINVKIVLTGIGFEFANTYSIFVSQSGNPLISLRAPPTC